MKREWLGRFGAPTCLRELEDPLTDRPETAAPGVESFWETCDADGVAENPLMRELCYRLDAIQRYNSLITEAEASGNDEAVEVLSRYYEQQQTIVKKIREQIERAKAENA